MHSKKEKKEGRKEREGTDRQTENEYGKTETKIESGIYLEPREYFSISVWIFGVSIPPSNVKSDPVQHEELTFG